MKLRLVVLLLACASFAQAQLEWKNTVLEFEPEFGTERVAGDYAFTNVGTTPIKILNVKPSCGCTTIQLDKKVYAPGESGVINASMSIDKEGGTRVKNIRVETDAEDPAQRTQSLIIRSEMKRLVDVNPRFVYWRNGEEPTPKIVEVELDPKQGLVVEDVVLLDKEKFTTELKTIKVNELYQVIVTPKSTTDPTYMYMTIKAHSEAAGYIDLKCYLKIFKAAND